LHVFYKQLFTSECIAIDTNTPGTHHNHSSVARSPARRLQFARYDRFGHYVQYPQPENLEPLEDSHPGLYHRLRNRSGKRVLCRQSCSFPAANSLSAQCSLYTRGTETMYHIHTTLINPYKSQKGQFSFFSILRSLFRPANTWPAIDGPRLNPAANSLGGLVHTNQSGNAFRSQTCGLAYREFIATFTAPHPLHHLVAPRRGEDIVDCRQFRNNPLLIAAPAAANAVVTRVSSSFGEECLSRSGKHDN
jgi:hypothetical protein